MGKEVKPLSVRLVELAQEGASTGAIKPAYQELLKKVIHSVRLQEVRELQQQEEQQ